MAATTFRWWDRIGDEEHSLVVNPGHDGVTLRVTLNEYEDHAVTLPHDLLGDLVRSLVAPPS